MPVRDQYCGGCGRALRRRVCTKAGIVADPDDIFQIKAAIEQLYTRFQQGNLKDRQDLSAVKQFDRKKLTADLCAIFDKVLQQHRSVQR